MKKANITSFGTRKRSIIQNRQHKSIKSKTAEQRRKHLDTVEDIKRRCFSTERMITWNFENDNGNTPQMEYACRYIEHWDKVKGTISATTYGAILTAAKATLPPVYNPPDIAPARIYSRILEMCVSIHVTGIQNRKQTAQRKMETLKKHIIDLREHL